MVPRDASKPASAPPTDEILGYWFGDLDDRALVEMQSPQVRRWHAKDPETDRDIAERFGAHYEAWRRSQVGLGIGSPRDRLALVILFDQFSRNMFRGTVAAYGTDDVALRLCLDGLTDQDDEVLPLIQRVFLYMPLMHAEDTGHQERTVQLFQRLVALAAERSPQSLGFFRMALGFASRHREIVERFGRFPHRNATLGRRSTAEEQEFLRREDSAF